MRLLWGLTCCSSSLGELAYPIKLASERRGSTMPFAVIARRPEDRRGNLYPRGRGARGRLLRRAMALLAMTGLGLREAEVASGLWGTHHRLMKEFSVRPDPDDPRLTRRVGGVDQEGRAVETSVVVERPLTLFLNGQEIVTMMTIGDHPDFLAVGYLLNQNMLRPDDKITAVDYD